MRNVIPLVLASCLLQLLGCLGGGNDPLVGRWEQVDGKGWYEFFSDGKFVRNADGLVPPSGSWKRLEDDRVRLEASILGTPLIELYSVDIDDRNGTFTDSDGRSHRYFQVSAIDKQLSLDYLNEAEAALEQGDSFQALKVARKSKKLYPTLTADYFIARALVQEGKNKEVIAHARDAKKAWPSLFGIFTLFEAEAHMRLGQLDESEQAYLTLSDGEEHRSLGFYGLGLIAYFRRHEADLDLYLDQAIFYGANEPKRVAAAHVVRGYFQSENRDFQGSRESAIKALESDPNSDGAVVLLKESQFHKTMLGGTEKFIPEVELLALRRDIALLAAGHWTGVLESSDGNQYSIEITLEDSLSKAVYRWAKLGSKDFHAHDMVVTLDPVDRTLKVSPEQKLQIVGGIYGRIEDYYIDVDLDRSSVAWSTPGSDVHLSRKS